MRRILSFCIFLFSVLSVSAQTNKLSKIAPNRLVEQSKKMGHSFEKVKLFRRTASTTPAANEHLRLELADFELFDLAIPGLKQISERTPHHIELSIPGKGGKNYELELVKADIFADGFTIRTSSSENVLEVDPGMHYRGIIKGETESIASISIVGDEVNGVFSSPELGNLVLNKVSGQLNTEQYVLFSERDRVEPLKFECEAGDQGPHYTKDELSAVTTAGFVDKCTNIYFEVDYDIYQDKGGTTQVTNYITSIFNEVATLYANEDLTIKISEIFIWDTPSPYSGSSSSAMLNRFQSNRKSFNGDLAQLLSYKASGGIAVLDGLCHPFTSAKMSFSSIGRSFRSIPNYSFTVMVVAHELGHLFGSHHTHACVWNGNNTALDGCAGFQEGSCRNPGVPSNGGTIMSYCHLKNVGINFSLGFGTQPGNVIRNSVAAASCLQVCSTGGGGDGGNGGGGNGGGDNGGGNGGGDNGGGGSGNSDCSDNEVTLRIVLDDYAMETSWSIKDANGQAVASGGPYKKETRGSEMTETFCLKDGCYDFEIVDGYGDGICCEYGQGSYTLRDNEGGILVQGGQFGFTETEEFCLNDSGSGGGGGSSNCLAIDFNDYSIQSYGGAQDRGIHEIQDDGTTLAIANNAWKAIELDYQVTPATVLEFEFGSTIIGEILGIGMDDNETISASKTFKLYGFQRWGIRDYDNYPGNEQWVKYQIPIGLYYSGVYKWLFFVADHDSGDQNGNAFFRNVKIYEGTSCNNANLEELDQNNLDSGKGQQKLLLRPNPASDFLHLNFNAGNASNSQVLIYNTVGQLMKSMNWNMVKGRNGEEIDVSNFPEGTYFLKLQSEGEEIVKRFTVVKP